MSGITHVDPGAQLTYAEYTGAGSHAVTANLVVGTWKITMAADGNESIRSDGSQILFEINSSDELGLDSSKLYPTTDGGLDLGGAGNEFADIHYQDQLISTVADGTAPMTVVSTTLVPNLNADTVDGYEATELAWPAVIPSEDLRVSDDADSGWASTSTFQKLKEILILRAGGWRIKWDHYMNGELDGYSAVFKNGVQFGSSWLISTKAWQPETEDLGFAVGDLCQLYARVTSGNSVKVRNFRLYAEAVYEQWGEVYT